MPPSVLTATSRMLFAFARDGGVPFSKHFAEVNDKWLTPVKAVWAGVALALGLPSLIFGLMAFFPKQIDFTTLYPAVTGISTVALYLSYGFPLLLRLRSGAKVEAGPWQLGKISRPVNIISIVWIGFITLLFVLPPNALTGYILGGVLLVLGIWFLLGVRGRFAGPPRVV